MRVPVMITVAFCVTALLLACEQLGTGSGGGAGAEAGAGAADASTVDASVVGGGCGTETNSGLSLCIATSMCPDVVVDTQSTPHCGFRIRGNQVDLVCGCGTSICPMGVFTTCAEARALLQTQTESAVCTQIAEERCTDTAATTPSSSSGGTGCDRTCLAQCGGGAGCASVCNCN